MTHSYKAYVVATAIALAPVATAFAQDAYSVPGVQFDGSGGVNVNVGGMQVKAGNGGATVDTGTGIKVNAANGSADVSVGDMRVNAGANGATVTLPGIGTIKTQGDVSTYIDAMAKADTNIQIATADPSQISLVYLEPAKLFGFIPFNVPTTATADSSGDISVDYPWYGFAVTGNKDAVQSALQQTVGQALKADGNATFSATLQAQILAAMQGVFNSIFKSSAQ